LRRYGEFYFVIYRAPDLNIAWKELTKEEHKLLSYIKEGLTLAEVCAKIEEEGGIFLETAREKIAFWFREWTMFKWLGEK